MSFTEGSFLLKSQDNVNIFKGHHMIESITMKLFNFFGHLISCISSVGQCTNLFIIFIYYMYSLK